VPWGFEVNGQVRHPSQLYEAGLEGLLLFVVLWWFTSRPRPRLAPSGLFLIIYGVARSLIEFVRVPDEHIGYLAGGWFTEGQLLSIPMILGGIIMMAWAYRRHTPSGNFAVAT
jgi:phosphatidylglycerol:prolipoprotein diacylglycerol transferase